MTHGTPMPRPKAPPLPLRGEGMGVGGHPQAANPLYDHDPLPRSRLTIYDEAPAETVPPKHWTDLPQADRERYLAARPRLRHMIWAGLSFGGAVLLFSLAYLQPDSARTFVKSTLGGGVLVIIGLIALYRAWRART